MFDGMQRAFPLERRSSPVTIVAIDEDSLRAEGQWPWPRTLVAELIEAIARLGPAAIALDLFFPEPDRYSPGAMAARLPLPPEVARALEAMPSNDRRLADAIRGRPVVLGIGASLAPDPRFARPPRASPVVVARGGADGLADYPGHIGSLPVIDEAARGRGLMNSGPADQVVRAVPLIARVQGAIVPSLGVEALRVASDSGLRVAAVPGGLLDLRFAGASVPLEADGTAWVRFAPHDDSRFVSASDVLAGKADRAQFEGKVVLVGIDGLGVEDFKTTPLGQFVPGVEIHAQIVENIFDGVSLVRPDWARWAEAASLLACALLVVGVVPRTSALRGVNFVALLVLGLAAAALYAFARRGLLLDPAWPALGTVAVYVGIVVGSLSEAERQRRQLREQAARLAGEMDAARRIQMGLLPDPAEVLGEDRRVRVAARLEPARTVGGDFYDCFRLDERRLFFAVADVSGKGLPAALFMAAVKAELKSAVAAGGRLGEEVLARAQREIARENPEHLFVTVFAGVLDLLTGELEYANAGHEAPFGRLPNGVPERFGSSGGPPLCVIDGFEWPTGRRTLRPGEWLCVVSDGVTEAMNARREFFTAERLKTALTWLPGDADPAQVVERVRSEVTRFAGEAEPADDITLLAVRWEGG